MTNPLSYTGITADNVGHFDRSLLARSLEIAARRGAEGGHTNFRQVQEDLLQRLSAGMGVPASVLNGTVVDVTDIGGRVLGQHLVGSWAPNPDRDRGAVLEDSARVTIDRGVCRQIGSVQELATAVLLGHPVTISRPIRTEEVFRQEHLNEWRPPEDGPMTVQQRLRAERESPVRPRNDAADALAFAVQALRSEPARFDTVPDQDTPLYEAPPTTQPSTKQPTEYQAKLLELKPLPSDVWGRATDPHDWHVVMFWSADHVEFGDYQDEYPKSYTPVEFRNKILDDAWELVYRHPEQPGAELARLRIRSENEINQPAPVQRTRRALRLRSQEHEVTDDRWYQNSTEQDLRSLGATE